MDAKQVIDRHVGKHHKYKLVPFLTGGSEHGITIVAPRKVAAHFTDSPVGTNFNYRIILACDGVQYVPVYGSVEVVF